MSPRRIDQRHAEQVAELAELEVAQAARMAFITRGGDGGVPGFRGLIRQQVAVWRDLHFVEAVPIPEYLLGRRRPVQTPHGGWRVFRPRTRLPSRRVSSFPDTDSPSSRTADSRGGRSRGPFETAS